LLHGVAGRTLQGANSQRRIQAGGDGREQQLFLEHAAAVVFDQRVVIAGRLAEGVVVDGVEQDEQALSIVARRPQPVGRHLPPVAFGAPILCRRAGGNLPQPG
jgi:hypothetical protein